MTRKHLRWLVAPLAAAALTLGWHTLNTNDTAAAPPFALQNDRGSDEADLPSDDDNAEDDFVRSGTCTSALHVRNIPSAFWDDACRIIPASAAEACATGVKRTDAVRDEHGDYQTICQIEYSPGLRKIERTPPYRVYTLGSFTTSCTPQGLLVESGNPHHWLPQRQDNGQRWHQTYDTDQGAYATAPQYQMCIYDSSSYGAAGSPVSDAQRRKIDARNDYGWRCAGNTDNAGALVTTYGECAHLDVHVEIRVPTTPTDYTSTAEFNVAIALASSANEHCFVTQAGGRALQNDTHAQMLKHGTNQLTDRVATNAWQVIPRGNNADCEYSVTFPTQNTANELTWHSDCDGNTGANPGRTPVITASDADSNGVVTVCAIYRTGTTEPPTTEPPTTVPPTTVPPTTVPPDRTPDATTFTLTVAAHFSPDLTAGDANDAPVTVTHDTTQTMLDGCTETAGQQTARRGAPVTWELVNRPDGAGGTQCRYVVQLAQCPVSTHRFNRGEWHGGNTDERPVIADNDDEHPAAYAAGGAVSSNRW